MEKWIKGFEGHYKVSTEGHIISYKGITPKVLKPCGTGDYLCVQLRLDGKTYYSSIHKIVAETFLNKPSPKHQVNHKSGIKEDNRLSNLEWVTPSENILHAYDNLLSKSRKVVNQYAANGLLVGTYKSIIEAQKQFNPNSKAIYSCCNGYNKTAYGFVWKKEESNATGDT